MTKKEMKKHFKHKHHLLWKLIYKNKYEETTNEIREYSKHRIYLVFIGWILCIIFSPIYIAISYFKDNEWFKYGSIYECIEKKHLKG